MQELFNLVEERAEEWSYTIVVSVVEIYNETVRDLLSLNHTEKLEIKQGPEGVYVPGLTQVEVSCLEEVNEVRWHGTQQYSTSSQSFCCYFLRLKPQQNLGIQRRQKA